MNASFPDETRTSRAKPEKLLTTLMLVTASSWPGRVDTARRLVLSNRWIAFVGAEEDAAYSDGKDARDSTYASAGNVTVLIVLEVVVNAAESTRDIVRIKRW